VLDVVPAETRFEVAGGHVVVPDDVGWIEELPPLAADAVVATKVTMAQQLEFAAGDGGDAAVAWAELLGPRGPGGRARLPVLAQAAWQAHRAGVAERTAALADELQAVLAELRPTDLAAPEHADALASAVLLAAARTKVVPTGLERLAAALPAPVAAPLLLRLREHGADTAALARQHAATAAARERLRRIDGELARGAEAGARAAGGDVLLWFPAEAAGAGRGALLPPAMLGERLVRESADGVPLVPDLARQVFAPATSANAAMDLVVDGLWSVAPRVSGEAPLFARQGAAIAAAVALLLVFLGSALFAGRALRQQANAVRARTEFVTVVTHELKTPLAAIRLLAEMLVEGRVPQGREQEYFRLLAGEAARLSMLIENVLDLGRVESGQRAYDLRPVDGVDLLREAAALFEPVAARDSVALELHCAAATAPLQADRSAMLQALLNVLDNARKYAAAGRRIELRASVVDGALAIDVRDFGPGVPPAERERIFERFERGGAHRHGSIPGVGLGLHLARLIVRRHGGDVACLPPQDGGAGTCFRFTLPLQRAEAA
jgi:signal transduction histidine kinase